MQVSMQRCESTAVLIENHQVPITELQNDRTFDTVQSEQTEKPPSIQVLGLLRRRTIQLAAFCEIQHKWELLKKIDLTHTIESFRDAIMIPMNKNLVIFHTRNGTISQVQNLSLDTFGVEKISTPNSADCAGLALFCLLNDEIYCFARADQQFYHK